MSLLHFQFRAEFKLFCCLRMNWKFLVAALLGSMQHNAAQFLHDAPEKIQGLLKFVVRTSQQPEMQNAWLKDAGHAATANADAAARVPLAFSALFTCVA